MQTKCRVHVPAEPMQDLRVWRIYGLSPSRGFPSPYTDPFFLARQGAWLTDRTHVLPGLG